MLVQGARLMDFVSGENHVDVGLSPSHGFGPDREEHAVPWDPRPILRFNIDAGNLSLSKQIRTTPARLGSDPYQLDYDTSLRHFVCHY